jgi:histidine triad (HIT) family protein
MPECIFCQIVEGRLPCARIYENERVLCFLDINPINPGHTLVIPKAHYATMLDITAEDMQACSLVTREVARAIFRATGAPGMNLLQNNFRPAGQHIDHIHFHLIPRRANDNFMTTWPARPADPSELETMLVKITAQM